VLYILGSTACWCPTSLHFFTRCLSRLLGLALISWAFARVGAHRLFPLRLPYLGVFFHSLFVHVPLDFILVSSIRPTYLHPFSRPFTRSLLGEFPGLGLALVGWYTMLWSQKRIRGAHEAKTVSILLPWPGYTCLGVLTISHKYLNFHFFKAYIV